MEIVNLLCAILGEEVMEEIVNNELGWVKRTARIADIRAKLGIVERADRSHQLLEATLTDGDGLIELGLVPHYLHIAIDRDDCAPKMRDDIACYQKIAEIICLSFMVAERRSQKQRAERQPGKGH